MSTISRTIYHYKIFYAYFNTTDQVHAYNTRSSSRSDYEIKFSILDKQGKSFSRLGAEIWNCIPPSIRKLPKHSFKLKIRDCLLQIHSQTDDYPDLPTLLRQMQRIQFNTVPKEFIFYLYIDTTHLD